MIRLIFVVVFVVLFLIVSIPILLVEWIIGKFNMHLKKRSSLAIVSWAFRVVSFLSGVKLTIIGKENIPADQPVLYIGNHRSYFDIVVSYALVPNLTGYIAKKQILKVPVLGQWMKNLDCLFLDRDDLRQGMEVILTAIEKVKSGVSICIYPEGTRNTTDQTLLPFKKGSFKIAQRSGCPIIPVTVNNTRDIFEAHPWYIKSQHVIIEYGAPVYYKDLEKEDQKNINEYVQSIIEKTYLKNQELLKK
ncbi:MAG: 1-acyl-sn-glycerol-3-phosphate acyltransferase [Butyrivibrio sp.]|jgi:1-acyl-sn-glycerol-3-phosphate acyltransferase|nr:1-acyl-sn-glycerol-3-phosphate acyltransferase [Butyrivibrio sp.]